MGERRKKILAAKKARKEAAMKVPGGKSKYAQKVAHRRAEAQAAEESNE